MIGYIEDYDPTVGWAPDDWRRYEWSVDTARICSAAKAGRYAHVQALLDALIAQGWQDDYARRVVVQAIADGYLLIGSGGEGRCVMVEQDARISEIRARHEASAFLDRSYCTDGHDATTCDVLALLKELDAMTAERDAWQALAEDRDERLTQANRNTTTMTKAAHDYKKERDALRARAEAALPDPGKLWALAEWLDVRFPNDANPEVQNDLRAWAKEIVATGARPGAWVREVLENCAALAAAGEGAARDGE